MQRRSGVNRCFWLLARDGSLFIRRREREPFASVFAIIPRRAGVLRKGNVKPPQRDLLGTVAGPLRHARIPLRFPAVLPRRVAGGERRGLRRPQRHRPDAARAKRQGVPLCAAMLFGELAIMLWLIIKGAKQKPLAATT
jgi:hypothetical protein